MTSPLSPDFSRTSGAGTPYPIGNTQAVNDLLTMMKSTLNTLGATFDNLGEQSAKVAALRPALDSARQIHELRKQMRAQEKNQDTRIGDIRRLVQDDLKVQIADHMREQIAEQIKSEIALQVKNEVDNQISQHLPTPLAIQAAESQLQLAEVKISLQNSEARRHNQQIRANNLDELLAVVLRRDGTPSPFFPANLKVLFSYELEMTRALVRDYGLVEHPMREGNLNRFMAFCGVSFHLIPPVFGAISGNTLGLST